MIVFIKEGQDRSLYYGSKYNQLDFFNNKKNRIDYSMYGYGVYVTPNINVAKQYATDKGYVYEIELLPDAKIVDFNEKIKYNLDGLLKYKQIYVKKYLNKLLEGNILEDMKYNSDIEVEDDEYDLSILYHSQEEIDSGYDVKLGYSLYLNGNQYDGLNYNQLIRYLFSYYIKNININLNPTLKDILGDIDTSLKNLKNSYSLLYAMLYDLTNNPRTASEILINEFNVDVFVAMGLDGIQYTIMNEDIMKIISINKI